MTESLYAEPLKLDADWSVNDPTKFRWYHSMDLPESGFVEGGWDLRDRFEDYTGHVDVGGKRFLDIGTASGFITFEAEKRGAEVVSVDIDDAQNIHRLPFPDEIADPIDEWRRSKNEGINRMKRTYWKAHNEFGSDARVYYGRATDLPAELGMFDVVILGQILVHNPDGISMIASAARRCRDKLIIAEGMQDNDKPLAFFNGRAETPRRDQAFWRYSRGFYQELAAIMGFEQVVEQTKPYVCNTPGYSRDIPITTLVFQRNSS